VRSIVRIGWGCVHSVEVSISGKLRPDRYQSQSPRPANETKKRCETLEYRSPQIDLHVGTYVKGKHVFDPDVVRIHFVGQLKESQRDDSNRLFQLIPNMLDRINLDQFGEFAAILVVMLPHQRPKVLFCRVHRHFRTKFQVGYVAG